MTMQLIASGTLSGSSTSIQNIPQDGTDLLLLLHMRTTANTTNATGYLQLNGYNTNVYSAVRFRGQPGFGISGVSVTNNFAPTSFEIPGTSVGSDNFSTVRAYFTNYTSSVAHPYSVEQVMSSNSSNNPYNIANGQTSRTQPITSIQIKEQQNSMTGEWSLYKIVTS